MRSKVLSEAQIEQFIRCGWTKVEEAIPRELALEAQDFVWERLAERGISKDDKSTWTAPMEFIKTSYNVAPFDRCATQKLTDACSDLVGDGRWKAQGEVGWWGYWPVNFAVGADETWDVPANHWHADGPETGWNFDSPDQGLLVICIFSQVGPRGGGTLALEGSHQGFARFLQANPGLGKEEARVAFLSSSDYLCALSGLDGAKLPEIDLSNTRGVDATAMQRTQKDENTPRIERFMNQIEIDENGTELRVIEITGSPGDCVLCHPFLFHSPSFNHSGVPRFMCNRKTPLFEPMQLEREDGNLSPLEESVRQSL